MSYVKPVLHLVMILFFAAYVMSCGPRYVRDYMDKKKACHQTERVSPGKLVKETLIKPYVRIWQSWQPVIEYGLALINVQGSQATGT